MRKSSFILSATVIGLSAITTIGIAVVLRRNGLEASDKVSQPPSVAQLSPPSAIHSNPTEVFQKAFWKRPTDADKILHAERREWTEAGDIRKWEWYLVVKPSPELLKHLIDENAFNLPVCPTPPPGDTAPPWFTYDSSRLESRGAASSGLRLSLDKASGLLYATDRGDGFQPGVSETSQATPTALPATKRIPLTSPPQSANP